jgi:hypothetical protein
VRCRQKGEDARVRCVVAHLQCEHDAPQLTLVNYAVRFASCLNRENLILARYKRDAETPKSQFSVPVMKDGASLAIEASISSVDACVIQMERKWGVNRLNNVCQDSDLRETMQNTLQEFNAAVFDGDAFMTKKRGTGIIKGYGFLEKHAIERGVEPLTAGRELEGLLPNGSILVIVPTHDSYVRPANETRDVTVIDMNAVIKLLAEKLEPVKMVSKHFPGAIVSEIRGKKGEKEPHDEIPF